MVVATAGAMADDLRRFLHDEPEPSPILVKAAMSHAQFETIHPFLDGNGRLGRLLIVLFMIEEQLLTTPLLYVSSYFEAHRSEYYDRLGAIRAKGDWEGWLRFFLTGVAVAANDAVRVAGSTVAHTPTT